MSFKKVNTFNKNIFIRQYERLSLYHYIKLLGVCWHPVSQVPISQFDLGHCPKKEVLSYCVIRSCASLWHTHISIDKHTHFQRIDSSEMLCIAIAIGQETLKLHIYKYLSESWVQLLTLYISPWSGLGIGLGTSLFSLCSIPVYLCAYDCLHF